MHNLPLGVRTPIVETHISRMKVKWLPALCAFPCRALLSATCVETDLIREFLGGGGGSIERALA